MIKIILLIFKKLFYLESLGVNVEKKEIDFAVSLRKYGKHAAKLFLV